MKKFRLMMFVVLAVLISTPNVFAATYKVDGAHTSVGFKVRHLFSNTAGTFNKFDGTIEFEAGKPETWKASGNIDVESINTNNEKRDTHLRSADFFDAKQFPQITFETTKVLESSAASAKLEGLMTMHGVQKPVVLDVEILGEGNDPYGNTRAGFTVKTKINRKDFGIVWNQTLDNGGLMLGEEVDITLEIEAILQK